MQRVTVTGDHAFVKFEQPYPQELFKERMSFRVSGWMFIPSVKSGMWDGYVSMLKRHTISTSLYRAIKDRLSHDCEVQFEENIRWSDPPPTHDGIVSDRDWQNECTDAMVENLSVGGGTIIAATSAGKTAMAAMFYSKVDGNHLFIVDQRKLLHQARADIAAFLNEPVGIVGDGTFEPGRVTVATIQTLRSSGKLDKLMRYLGALETIIVDEVHVQLAGSNFDVVAAIKPRAKFGLTATLQMSQLEVWLKVSAFSGPVIYTYDIKRGMDDKILSKVHYHQIRFAPIISPSKLKERKDEIKLAVENRLIPPPTIDAFQENVVDHPTKQRALRWLVRGYLKRNRYIVVLVDKYKHIDVVARVLHEFNPMIVTGKVKGTLIDERISEFEAGNNRLIIASRVFNKGVSIKRIDTILNVGELEDANTIVQQIGRELRLHVDKDGAIFVDFGTTTGRYRESAQARLDAVNAAGIPTTLWNWDRDQQRFFEAVAPARQEPAV